MTSCSLSTPTATRTRKPPAPGSLRRSPPSPRPASEQKTAARLGEYGIDLPSESDLTGSDAAAIAMKFSERKHIEPLREALIQDLGVERPLERVALDRYLIAYRHARHVEDLLQQEFLKSGLDAPKRLLELLRAQAVAEETLHRCHDVLRGVCGDRARELNASGAQLVGLKGGKYRQRSRKRALG